MLHASTSANNHLSTGTGTGTKNPPGRFDHIFRPLTTNNNEQKQQLPSKATPREPSTINNNRPVTSSDNVRAPITTTTTTMMVRKRSGAEEPIRFDKITERILKCVNEPTPLDTRYINHVLVAKNTISGVYPGVHTRELDELAAEDAAYRISEHPDYGRLAARIAVSSLHKETPNTFKEASSLLFHHKNIISNVDQPLITADIWNIIELHYKEIEQHIVKERDYSFDYFGFKTLCRGYLLRRSDNKIIERPQYMYMRIALGIHMTDLESVFETYDLLSKGMFTHATPTLYNAGTPNNQMSSCFLLPIPGDSIDGIYEGLNRCAKISKYAGGIGISCHNIRASKSYIHGTNGRSNGLIPMLRVYNETARYVDQGGGKRKGAFAVYLEPWHADIVGFLDLKRNNGKEEIRARDLFYALWIPDLFMRRVHDNGQWTLFCPHEAPGLADVYGKEFDKLYCSYELKAELRRKTMKARDLWFQILESQIETGSPYMLYKDQCNRLSNQQNLGTIKSSNLCTEIMQYSSADEVAVCNLASIALPNYINRSTMTFDHQLLYDVVRVITRNLNKIISINFYPIAQCRLSNLRHRPIGIGVQGEADLFIELRMPFDGPEARQLNQEIFETIYFAALSESHALAEKEGPYDSYEGSPLSKGQFHFDLMANHFQELQKETLNNNNNSSSNDSVVPSSSLPSISPPLSGRWPWDELRTAIVNGKGVKNSLFVAPMPTASTSQILGNNECFEPYTSNIYSRRTLAGDFTVVNKHLVSDLITLGLWSIAMKNEIIRHRGSIQQIDDIPLNIRHLYRTVWEMSNKHYIDMAADRQWFIDQSQSMNLFMAQPTITKLTSMHFYAWEKGLKTGMYYLRSLPAADAIQFTVEQRQTTRKHARDTATTTTTAAAALAAVVDNNNNVNDTFPTTTVATTKRALVVGKEYLMSENSTTDPSDDQQLSSLLTRSTDSCQYSLDGQFDGCNNCGS